MSIREDFEAYRRAAPYAFEQEQKAKALQTLMKDFPEVVAMANLAGMPFERFVAFVKRAVIT